MATDQEILDILIAIRAQGLAEADAVNAIISKTGNTALGAAGQVGVLTAAHERASGSFKNYETSLKNAVIVSGEAGSITDGLARKMNALGQLGVTPASIAMLGGVVAVGAMVSAGKSAIDIAEQNEKADKSLAQAYGQLGKAVPTAEIDGFIQKNKAFIPSIAQTKEGFATLARAGMDSTMQARLMNDALDLSRAKSIDLSTAINTLLMAEGGRATGLLQLGINVREIADPEKELAKAVKEQSLAKDQWWAADRRVQEEEQRLHDKSVVSKNDLMTLTDLRNKDAAAYQKLADANQNLSAAQGLVNDKGDRFKSILDQVEPKIAGARGNSTQLEQSMSKLNTDWQDLADKSGPGLVTVIDDVVNGLDGVYSDLVKIGQDNKLWGDISKHATDLAGDVGRTVAAASGKPTTPTGPAQSGSKVQWDPTTKTWTWAVGPNGTIASHGPGEYVDPATGMIYAVNNPQEQSGPRRPQPQDFGLDPGSRNPRGGQDGQIQAYNIALKQWEVADQARKDALANYQAMQAQLNQIASNTKQRPSVVINYQAGASADPNTVARALLAGLRA